MRNKPCDGERDGKVLRNLQELKEKQEVTKVPGDRKGFHCERSGF